VASTVLLAAAWTPVRAQSPVRYEIGFSNRAHHEATVTVRWDELAPGSTLEVRMSRTSPGRYALHEFAKNVYDFHATDGRGGEVDVRRPNPHQWDVSGHDGSVEVTYRLFADRADGTYSGIDASHAHLNVPATFMWARGQFERPVELTVRIPEGSGWRVATQLVPAAPAPDGATAVFTAPDHAYFFDSPVEVSDFDLREWTVDGRRIRVAMHHLGTEAELDAFVRDLRSVVLAERDVFGELPDFDHGEYTFLACYLPWADGDGMEHRNSTVLTSTASLAGASTGLLGTAAHEFFHSWNMERIRAASLEPFDFEEANMSRELWFGEGFTSYYDDLSLVRAGVISREDYARRIAGSLDFVINAPGRRYFSPVEMSMQAPFVDAAISVDPTNHENTFVSYYTWGSILGLGLDLALRTRFPDLDLDDFMREVWREHGTVRRPYTVEDLEAVLGRVTGDRAFAAEFFDRYVRGREVLDYATLLARAGFRMERANPGTPILHRTALRPGREGLQVVAPTLRGTPLYEAGVDRRDLVLSVGGTPVRNARELERALEGHAPGDRVEVVFRSRGRRRSATVALQEDPALRVVPVARPTGDEAAFREAWLGGR
jgi:predicted metalloprotease with PDZ domain